MLAELVKDPVVRRVPPECVPFCEVSVRCGEEEFAVLVEGDEAEKLAEFGEAGVPVVVDGRLTQETWETAEGSARSRVVVAADKVRVAAPPTARKAYGEDVP